MLKFLILVAILFGVALGFHRLKDTSGEVALTIGDTAYAVDLTTAVIALIAGLIVAVGLIWFVRELLGAPWRLASNLRRRNEERGSAAISQGLIAVAAGDIRGAERAMLEAVRRAPELPLARLLQAQTAQLKGDRPTARLVFQDMTEEPRTRIAGLRGLYVEAEREGELEAARQIAERAHDEAPSAPWAARALLRHQTAASDWNGALKTLSAAADGRILDKRTARRQRAVILAAEAIDREAGDPDGARQAAQEAHELAPDLVPAAVTAGRLLSRQGDIRRAARVLETTWKTAPHPDLADAYVHVRSGDAAGDRLKRAETLFRLRTEADEGRLAVARAAIDARDFRRAREVLTPVLTTRPTQRALILMAELEESETGNSGRAREWLARAVHAPRDAVWTADGVVLEAWAPASPVTGRLDTVEWKVPVTELEAPRLRIDAADLQPAAPPEPAAGEAGAHAAAAEAEEAAPGTLVARIGATPAERAAGAKAEGPPRQPTNGAGLATERSGDDIPPPHGAVPAGATGATPAAGGAAKPPLPDDPGVNEGGAGEPDKRRFRVL